MMLANFIRDSSSQIVSLSVEFARSIPMLANRKIDVSVLADHLPQIRAQSPLISSSRNRVARASQSLKVLHRALRLKRRLRPTAECGPTQDLRSIRSSPSIVVDAAAADELARFHEAIDQAVAESVAFHSAEVERWRNTLLAIVGHDLRDPLNTIAVTAQVMEGELRNSPLEAPVRVLTRGAQRLRVLLDSLLEYSSAGLGTPMILHCSERDLERACRAELDLLHSAFPQAEIRMTSRGPLTALFDESRVRQALANLIANAAQYRAPETAVEVFLSGDSGCVEIKVRNAVADPIEPRTLESLFEPLRSRDGIREGSRRNFGLGLFIVREIAKAHGGNVVAEASGSLVTFKISLPRTGPRQSAAGPR
jgi:signal transduction histidine kinase